MPIALFASSWAGLPFVPLNYRLTGAELDALLDRIKPVYLVTDADRAANLAGTEGIFTETAGGVTMGATKILIEQGKIPRDGGPIVVSITGNGMKTQDPLVAEIPKPALIGPKLSDFDALKESWTG